MVSATFGLATIGGIINADAMRTGAQEKGQDQHSQYKTF